MPISATESAFFSTVGINPADVGAVLATGTQNRVRPYVDPATHQKKVIKTPIRYVSRDIREQFWNIFTRQTAEQAQAEYEMCMRYFKPYCVPTDIVQAPDGKNFVIVQDSIDFEDLTLEIVQTRADVARQLQDIFTRNGDMLKEGRWLDVAGFNVLKIADLLCSGRPYSDNIVLASDGLKIIDYGLFPNANRIPLWVQQKNARAFGMSFDGSSRS